MTGSSDLGLTRTMKTARAKVAKLKTHTALLTLHFLEKSDQRVLKEILDMGFLRKIPPALYGRFLKMLVGFFGRSDSKICDTGMTGYILGVFLVFLFFDMAIKKTLAVVFAVVVILPSASFAAFETGALRVDINDAIQRLVTKYEARIAELETENAELKKKLSGLAPGTVVTVNASTGTSLSAQPSKPVSNDASTSANVGSSIVAKTGNADYDALVKSMNSEFPSILKENGLPETAQL